MKPNGSGIGECGAKLVAAHHEIKIAGNDEALVKAVCRLKDAVNKTPTWIGIIPKSGLKRLFRTTNLPLSRSMA